MSLCCKVLHDVEVIRERLREGAVAPHNPKAGGSSPSPAILQKRRFRKRERLFLLKLVTFFAAAVV